MKSIYTLFALFQLDRLIQTQEDVTEDILLELLGGLTNDPHCFLTQGTQYKLRDRPTPWQYWRLYGKCFDIDVLYRGKGRYVVTKVVKIK